MTSTTTPHGIETRKVTISARKAANAGRTYLDTFVGLDVVAMTDSLGPVLGTIIGWWDVTGQPIIGLDNGRTFRGGRDLLVVTNIDDL